MRLSPWLTLRQIQDALRTGRPEEAHRLLLPLLNEGYRRAWKRAREVAIAYVAAGEKALRGDDPESAWQKLLAAESLNTGEPKTGVLRQSLTRLALAECRAALEAGHPTHVIEAVARIRSRSALHQDFETIEHLARDWAQAEEMADRGDFPLAISTLHRVRSQLGTIPAAGLERYLAELERRHETYRSAVAELNEAASIRHWTLAAEWAAKVMAVAPAHREARNLQARAWGAAQPHTAPYKPDAEVIELVPLASTATMTDKATQQQGVPKRFLLWIDGVGGYLVCLNARVSFGQAAGDAPIDIPLQADLSKLHAELARDGEGYILESSRGILVNNAATTRTALKPGDRVTLGATCQFVFHRDVEISPSARLELVSGHRLQIAVDGVLLMAESIILGPSAQSHVVIPWLEEPVVLYRSKEGLGVRLKGAFQVDAKAELNRALLPLPSVVSSPLLHFAVEAVPARL